MKTIDITTWPRRHIFHFFNRMDYPQYNVCANVDVSLTIAYLDSHNQSFFKSVLYVTCSVANAIAEFRHRIRDGQVVEHDLVHPSFTVLTDEKLFGFCAVEYTADIKTFFERTQRAIAQAKKAPTLADEAGRDDYLFVSSLPWIHFTSISHPIHMHPADSVPRISWGKPAAENGKILMPLSVQVHHGLADGYHLGAYFEQVQHMFDQPEKTLSMS